MDTNNGAEKRHTKKRDKWENYEYSPASQNVSDLSLAIGLCLRAACVVMLTFGLAFFLDDAFSLNSGGFSLFLKSLLTTAVFALLLVGGKKGALVGAAVGAASVGLTAIIHGGLFGYFSGCIAYTRDSVVRYLVALGYDNYAVHIKGAGNMGLDNGALHGGAMTVLILVLSLVFTLCVMRKTILFPTLVLSMAVLILGFTFNTSSSSVGFAFVVLALSGITVMRVFDRYFKAKRKDRRRLASLGGYTGGSVMLIALLTIIIPMFTITESWERIDFISSPIEVARDVVDSVLNGDAPNLKDMGVIKNMDDFNSRDTTPKKLEFTGETLITVKTSYNRDIPIYLRGWIATDFDGNVWSAVSNDRVTSYMSLMKEVAAGAGYKDGAYRTEFMTSDFYEMLDPSLLLIDREAGYTNNYDNGYISMYLNVKQSPGKGMGNLVYLPTLSSAEGLRKYGNAEKAYKYGYRSYFDGMLVTGWLNFHKEYTVSAYVPIMSSKSYGVTLETQINYYKAMRELMELSRTVDYSPSNHGDLVADTLARYGLTEYIGKETYFDKYMQLSAEEQAQVYQKYVSLVKVYSEYAMGAYGKEANKSNSVIDGFVKQIYDQPSHYGVTADSFTHDKVLAVVKFINERYGYNLYPAFEEDMGYEGFLKKTREGYYVQFATTAALMLRSMGIPARYVEGYIAADFAPCEDDEELFLCEVTDKQAHAWVEVYYEGYGWLPYETTSRYMRAYYGSAIDMGSSGGTGVPGGSGGGIGSGDSHAPEDIAPIEPGDIPTEEPTENVSAGKVLLIIIFVLGGVAIAVFAVKKLRDRADAIIADRRQVITDAINKNIEDDDIAVYAKQINGLVFQMFAIGGYSPNVGELPREFAARMENDSDVLIGKTESFSEIMQLIQKNEFGNGVSRSELAKIAGYLDSLWKDVYRTKSRPKQIWHRYILCDL